MNPVCLYCAQPIPNSIYKNYIYCEQCDVDYYFDLVNDLPRLNLFVIKLDKSCFISYSPPIGSIMLFLVNGQSSLSYPISNFDPLLPIPQIKQKIYRIINFS